MSTRRSPIIIRPSRRRQESKQQIEQRKQRALLVAAAIAIFFILAIPAYGYWSNFIAPPRSVVLQVDNNEYTLGFMADYLIGVQNLTGPLNMSKEPIALLSMLQQNELVKSGTERKGITIPTDELDKEIKERMIGNSPQFADLPEDQVEREFNEAYIQYLDTSNLSEEEHRDLVRNNLLKEKLKDSLGDDIPTSSKQAKMSWIVIPSKREEGEDAMIASQKAVETVSRGLEIGEDFTVLAEKYSQDRNTAVNGGYYGWVAEGAFGILDETIFSLSAGETSEAIETGDTTYFFTVSETEEDRMIDEEMLDRLKEVALLEWLREEQGNHRITSCFGGGSAGGPCDWQMDWLTKRVRTALPEDVSQQ